MSGPRRHRAGGWSARAGAADLHSQPRLGQVYVRSLVRDQLRLALGVLAILGVVLGGVPAALALLPGLGTAEVYGFRVAWLLLGLVAYPVLVGLAWFHVRHAERVERDFTELLNGPAPSAPDASSAADAAPGPRAGSGGAAAAGACGRLRVDGATVSEEGPGPGADPACSGPGSGSGADVTRPGTGSGADRGARPDRRPGAGGG